MEVTSDAGLHIARALASHHFPLDEPHEQTRGTRAIEWRRLMMGLCACC